MKKKKKTIYPYSSVDSIFGCVVNPGEMNFLELLGHINLFHASLSFLMFSAPTVLFRLALPLLHLLSLTHF